MKELMMIGGGVTGGALSNGLSSMMPTTTNPMLVNGVMAVATGFAATKVDGFDGKNKFLKSMLIGAAVVSGLGLFKNVMQKTGVAGKLESPTKVNQFFKGFTGLGCPHDSLNAYEFEESLNAFDDADNLALMAYDEPIYAQDNAQLLGYEDEQLHGTAERQFIF